MKFSSVNEIFESNDSIRDRLKHLLREIPESVIEAKPADGDWSIRMIAEHISIVDEGMLRICTKLLSKAEANDATGDGSIAVSASFTEKAAAAADTRLKAPEMVEPSGNVTLAEIVDRLDRNTLAWKDLRTKFNTLNSAEHTFPHPYFGDLNAQDWLVLRGGHEMRHIKQIGRIAKSMSPD